ncbi:MAG: hypothetical protein ACOYM5_02850 [Caulobacter sp.]
MTKAVDDRRRAMAVDPDSRVERALRRASSGDDAAMKRAAFRRRWNALAATSTPDEPELMIKVGVLFERIGEVVSDLEDGAGGEPLGAAMIGALEAIDALDERLGDIERWLRAVAGRQGVVVPAPGKGVRS